MHASWRQFIVAICSFRSYSVIIRVILEVEWKGCIVCSSFSNLLAGHIREFDCGVQHGFVCGNMS